MENGDESHEENEYREAQGWADKYLKSRKYSIEKQSNWCCRLSHTLLTGYDLDASFMENLHARLIR